MKKLSVTVALIAVCIALSAGSAWAEIPEITNLKTDYMIPDNEAMAFIQAMGAGWNLGNTFDASDCTWIRNELEYEKAWCGAYTTYDMIKLLKSTGFNTLRIPISWHNHVSGEDFVISAAWLDRIQTVVDWAIGMDMYVIINTHHDMDRNYCYPDSEHYGVSEKYIISVWTQLAERFRDYDGHLIFECMNEPRLKDTAYEWYLNKLMPECRDAADCINRLNQAFVDTVRAAGGCNAGRYLMVPAYDASPENAVGDLFCLPADTVNNRIIVSVHAYTPYDFALAAGGNRAFSHTTLAQTSQIGTFMNTLYNKYIVNGIPVVIGEYGARDKSGNTQDRINFAAYYTASAHVRGIACCWWDNNAFTGSGENFGILNRAKCVWAYPEIAEAIIRYSAFGD